MIVSETGHGWRPIAALRAMFRVAESDPDLMRSQVAALAPRIPLLYFIAFVNTVAVAWTHYGIAPPCLTIAFPALVMILGLARGRLWLQRGIRPISAAAASRGLRSTVATVPILCATFFLWAAALYQYGDAYAQGHVVFYIAITIVSCTFCLMHLRPAALLLTFVTVIPFTIFMAATQRPVFVAIGFNMLLVAAAMVYVVINHSRDFANLIGSQRQLLAAETADAERTRMAAEAELAAQREILKHAGRFELALNNMLHGLCMFDVNDRLIVCNARYAEMYSLPDWLMRPGVERRDILKHRAATWGYSNFDVEEHLSRGWDTGSSRLEATTLRQLSDGRTILIHRRPIKEGGWVVIHEDVTDKHKAEERLSHVARHDALTGLPNRVLLHERMEQAVAGLKHGGAFAVLCIDLDHFNETNDALGHPVGDALLREIAGRLRSCVHDGDTVARIGGDDFAIVHVGSADSHEVGALARRLLEVLTQPYEIQGHQINIGASVGISRAPLDDCASAPLLRLADIALSRAKSEGRRTHRFFEASMDCELQSRRNLEIDFRRALAEEEFEVYFQPINDATTRAIKSFEALARWRHPQRGMISPTEFIPLAEETGLIVPLGAWVLRTACAEATRWPADVRVSVNLSAVQFQSGDLADTVRDAIAGTGLAADRLELEITESVLLDGSCANLATLHALRSLGVRIALDDFGTGYSSLSYLRSFPFDKLKIDQSFVKNIDQRDAREIVRAISGLGRTLGMVTTAEGVETEAQLAAMNEYGCIEVQGYLFSHPVPSTELHTVFGRFPACDRSLEMLEKREMDLLHCGSYI